MCKKREVVFLAMAVVFSFADIAVTAKRKIRPSMRNETTENCNMTMFNNNSTQTNSRHIKEYRLLDDICRMGFEEAPLRTFPEIVSNTSQVELDNIVNANSASNSHVNCATTTDQIVPTIVSIVGTVFEVVHYPNNYQIVFYGSCSSGSAEECVLRLTWRSLLVRSSGSDVFVNIQHPTSCECN